MRILYLFIYYITYIIKFNLDWKYSFYYFRQDILVFLIECIYYYFNDLSIIFNE